MLLDSGQKLEVDGNWPDVSKKGPLHVAPENENVAVMELCCSGEQRSTLGGGQSLRHLSTVQLGQQTQWLSRCFVREGQTDDCSVMAIRR